MNEPILHKHPSEAIKYLRTKLFGKEIPYSYAASVLSLYGDRDISKAEVWNVENNKYRCPKHMRKALEAMGLYEHKRRYRFFFEVSKKEYERINEWLEEEGMTFSQAVRESNIPWA